MKKYTQFLTTNNSFQNATSEMLNLTNEKRAFSIYKLQFRDGYETREKCQIKLYFFTFYFLLYTSLEQKGIPL
jgi:hypothetical protein